MESLQPNIEPGLVVAFILLYTILGPLGTLPAVLGVIIILFARSTTFLELTLSEHQNHKHGKGRDVLGQLKAELLRAARKDAASHAAMETAGLRAQIGMLTQEVAKLQDGRSQAKTSLANANGSIKELQALQRTLQTELDAVKKELAESGSSPQQEPQDGKTSEGPIQAPSTARSTRSLESTKSVAIAGFGLNANPSLSGKPGRSVAVVAAQPLSQPAPVKIQLPHQLQNLNPTGSGFRCIGRALASHGGPCGSFSNEYLPQSGREQAAATLRGMRSTNPNDSLFELSSLRDLANNMLCIRHRGGVRYDQSNTIADSWHKALAEQVRDRRESQKVATTTPVKSFTAFTQSTVPTTVVSPIESRPVSPASSVGSTSTAATTPETLDERHRGLTADKPIFEFGKPQRFSFGTPTPAGKDMFRF